MAVLLVVMSMFSFGVLTFNVPASVSGGAGGGGRGLAGSAGMGFLAALLSTPCSFAILAAAFAWAQGQSLAFATVAIMLIGAGMSAPYAILTAAPGLLRRLPRPGHWMEIFKKGIGFVMLLIAVKLVSALPQTGRMDMVYFAVVLAFCLWMWGGWVGLNTARGRKWIIRGLAVVLAAAAAWAFLAPSGKPVIDWQGYDAAAIERAVASGRPVLVEFSADWCLSCAVVERRVYARKDVAALIKEKNVLAVKADTTRKDSPATAALGQVYGEPGVPVTILYVPGDPTPARWHGLSFGDELAAALRKLPVR
jgi:thiol:disulfide interchange protein DsbD